jgi:hypothetical protein
MIEADITGAVQTAIGAVAVVTLTGGLAIPEAVLGVIIASSVSSIWQLSANIWNHF